MDELEIRKEPVRFPKHQKISRDPHNRFKKEICDLLKFVPTDDLSTDNRHKDWVVNQIIALKFVLYNYSESEMVSILRSMESKTMNETRRLRIHSTFKDVSKYKW